MARRIVLSVVINGEVAEELLAVQSDPKRLAAVFNSHVRDAVYMNTLIAAGLTHERIVRHTKATVQVLG